VANVVLLDKSAESVIDVHLNSSDDRWDGYDPSLVVAARKIYRTYYDVHPEVTELPLGVAIDRFSCRGKLIFVRMPALLPQETFIPLEIIDRV
jgi:hypothetical protein